MFVSDPQPIPSMKTAQLSLCVKTQNEFVTKGPQNFHGSFAPKYHYHQSARAHADSIRDYIYSTTPRQTDRWTLPKVLAPGYTVNNKIEMLKKC